MRKRWLKGIAPWLMGVVLVGYMGMAGRDLMDEARAASVDVHCGSAQVLSPIYIEKLEQSLAAFDTEGFLYAGLIQQPGTESQPATNPSFNLSGCLASICIGSSCFGSGCGGSYCFGSACPGSYCAGSGCQNSYCILSGCSQSTCVESRCTNSGCAESNCFNSNCSTSACIDPIGCPF